MFTFFEDQVVTKIHKLWNKRKMIYEINLPKSPDHYHNMRN